MSEVAEKPIDPPGGLRAVLLAAGLGTRLRPLTDRTPKCLIEIAGRPLLDYWIDRLAAAEVADVLVNTHHLPEAVRRYIEHVNRGGRLRMHEAFEPELLGSAGTIHANRDFVDTADECLIIYADNLSDVDLAALMAFHRGHDDPMTMMLFHAPRPEACGIAELDHDDRVVSFVEKPRSPSSDLANAGVYVVDGAACREIADMDVHDFGFNVLPRFVGRMRGWVWGGYHLDIGTPEALERARADAASVFDRGAETTP